QSVALSRALHSAERCTQQSVALSRALQLARIATTCFWGGVMRIPLVNLLVRSPLPRLREQMLSVVECAEMVPELIDALTRGDHLTIVQLARDTSVLEVRCDELKNSLQANMPTRLLLPVDRRDLLKLVAQIDATANCAEDVGVLLTLRHMEVPEELTPTLKTFVDQVMDVVRTSQRLVDLIEPLIQSSFGGRPANEARAIIEELGRKEHKADKLQDQCAKILFSLEHELPPVGVFMWTKILNKIGDMANHSERVGDQFRLFLAR
ncbi:MAG: TIGR00153 family protein, partial [Myxococcota bacterium]